jgi:hypothetical protein
VNRSWPIKVRWKGDWMNPRFKTTTDLNVRSGPGAAYGIVRYNAYGRGFQYGIKIPGVVYQGA